MKCEFCRKDFDAYKYNIKKGFGKYCSKGCSNRAKPRGFEKGHKSFWTEETKRVVRLKLNGRVVPQETRDKISQSHIKRWDKIGRNPKKYIRKERTGTNKTCPECSNLFYVAKGQVVRRKYCSKKCLFASDKWREEIHQRQTGKSVKEETKEKLSRIFRGENSSLWMGGRGLVSKSLRQRPEYNQWRRSVLKRDNYSCINCGSQNKLNADHIVPVVEDESLVFEISNGRTLCWSCHNEVTICWRKNKWKKKL